MGHNLETTTERLSVLANCNAPIVKILVNVRHKILLVITEGNMLMEYKFTDEYYRGVTELQKVVHNPSVNLNLHIRYYSVVFLVTVETGFSVE